MLKEASGSKRRGMSFGACTARVAETPASRHVFECGRSSSLWAGRSAVAWCLVKLKPKLPDGLAWGEAAQLDEALMNEHGAQAD